MGDDNSRQSGAAPRILIQGVGAMGGVAAARLLHAGLNPTLVAGSEQNAQAIEAKGVTLIAGEETTCVPARAVASVQDIPPAETFDIVLIFTKADAVEGAAMDALPRLHDESIVLGMQNGVIEPIIAGIVGEDRVIASLCNWAATMREMGVYEHTVQTLTVLGEFSGEITQRLQALKSVMSCIAPVQLSPNILGAQWSKLAMNCTVTSLGAIAGSPLSDILTTREGRAVFFAVYLEVLRVARAAGVHIEKLVLEPFVPVEGSPEEVEAWLDEALVVYGRSKPSILQDLERGRLTEIDFIVGHVVRTAGEVNIQAPLCAAITRMTHECERGERSWRLENIAELAGIIRENQILA